jgi:plastocyanin
MSNSILKKIPDKCAAFSGMMIFIVSILFVLLSFTAEAAWAGDDAARVAKICTKAEQRYQDIYGKPSAEAGAVVVKLYKYTFCPQQITVKQGTKVLWINVDKRTSHSVWHKAAGQPESDRFFPEEQVGAVVDFPPGTYDYLCGPHWETEGMVGRMTVQAK